ncbi:PTS sugar transporter subunit IIB [Clostridium butyricum]|uniref:PTS sugar transporter subunit IIB n=1 Tax=Clostridium butyricum TaxID=1492 RepID=UPI00136B3BF7|nr:PTS sugar transporter subunit IIB [Clostridium butyricum]MBS5983376.1 PTS sugar transporter subunit IIB [Clostridium butyricum]MZI82720.1 PTS sugar transporter subunit IIB [Clostridium butyricum]
MKNILLVCNAGMSTSLLVNKMKEEAVARGVEVNINALPVAEVKEAIDKVDIVLLGPQVRFQKAQVEEYAAGRIPVEVIDIRAYGAMNGKAVLESALEKIK